MVDLIITPPFSSVKSADSFKNVNIVNARGEPQLNGLLQTTSCPAHYGPREFTAKHSLLTVPPTLDFTIPELHSCTGIQCERHYLPIQSGFLM